METYSEKKKLPDFLTEAERQRFISKVETRFVKPKLMKSKNAWLTYTGLCFSYFHFFKSTSYHLAYSQWSYIVQCIYHFVTKSRKSFDEPCYFVHSTWSMGNYHHWLVDSLPRFKPFLGQFQTKKLILPEQLYSQAFIQQSLHLLGVENIAVLKKGELAKLNQVEFAELTPGDFTVNHDLKFMVDLLKKKCVDNPELEPTRILFLSRQNVGYRKIDNYEDVENLMAKYHIEVVSPENMNLQEQIRLFAETKILVSVHGAGLTNAIFMSEGSVLLELHPAIENESDIFNYIYWNLAEHFGLRYYFLGCQPVDKDERFHTANLKVDIEKLTILLDKILR